MKVTVEQDLEITVDESRFTPEFLQGFKESFYPCETIEDHVEFIAESFAQGVVRSDADFLEGYGVLRDFGIRVKREEPATWINLE